MEKCTKGSGDGELEGWQGE